MDRYPESEDGTKGGPEKKVMTQGLWIDYFGACKLLGT